jgi:hypothetical protein
MHGDTTDAARQVQLDALRRLGPTGRVALALRMSEDARSLAVEGILRRHPSMTRREAERTMFARLWGPELAAKVEAFVNGDR